MNIIDDAAGEPARPGYDHDWFGWSPLPERPAPRWPDGARVAVSVVVHLGAVEWEHPDPPVIPPPGGRGIGPAPDFPRMSHREFGHRVGIFRLLRILAGHGVAPAAVVDVLTAEHYPALMPHLLDAASEILAGGLSASRPVTGVMTADEERHYIGETLRRLGGALPTAPTGWLGPEHSESDRTPALLAEAGLRYVADWANDERPYPMRDGLWCYPLSWELSDVSAMFLRQVSPSTWARSVIGAFDVLHAEGGRVLGLHLNPWVTGQAFRAGAVDAVLRHIRGHDGVWFAGPGEVVDWCSHASR